MGSVPAPSCRLPVTARLAAECGPLQLDASPSKPSNATAVWYFVSPEACGPEVVEGDSQRGSRGDAQNEHVGVEEQRVRQPLQRAQRQEAERFFTQIQVCIEVSGEQMQGEALHSKQDK